MNIFDLGVGQWPGTPRPGQRGNIVLGGHRTAATRPFLDIDKLRSGDIIELHSKGQVHKYKVTGHLIVKPTAIWITDPTSAPTLTLFACHPKGSTAKRYVVRASLIS
jgi:sortase A